MLSREESDKKKAHADISMKLGKMFISMSNLKMYYNRNWPIFKMAALKSKMAAKK